MSNIEIQLGHSNTADVALKRNHLNQKIRW